MLVDSLVRVAMFGSSWVLYLLITLSVVSFAAMLERTLFFRRNGRHATVLADALRKAVVDDDEAAVDRALAHGASVESVVLRDALAFREGGPEAVTDAVDASLGRERKALERSMTLLGTLGNNAPFVGLFGTVLGIVSAFKELGNAGATGQMGNVMSGISEALIATGVGLVVAIPAVVTFNYFQSRATQVEDNVATLTNYLFAQMKSLGGAPMHAHGNHVQQPQTEQAAQTEQAFSSPAV